MTPAAVRRAAALGLVAVLTPAPARADGWLHPFAHKRGCDAGCADTQRVTLPARSIEVVTEKPRVVVRESAPVRERVITRGVDVVTRGVEVSPLAIGTVYMPLAFPTFGGVVGGTREVVTRDPAPVCRDAADDRPAARGNPFEAAHRAEVAAFNADLAKQEALRTVEATSRILGRIGTTAAPPAAEGAIPPNIEQRLTELTNQINKLNERVSAVEKLVLFHDNALQRLLPPQGPPLPSPTTPPMLPAPTPMGK